MCQECGFIFCADRCPNYGVGRSVRGRRIRRCSQCGQAVYDTELYLEWLFEGTVLCETCRTNGQIQEQEADF